MTKLYNKEKLLETRRALRKEMTYAEKIMWLNIRKEKILGVKFRRQFSVGLFVLDFYAPSIRLAIEVDGASHEWEGQPEKDLHRQRWIELNANIEFLRFTDAEVCNWPDDVVARIEARVRERLDVLY